MHRHGALELLVVLPDGSKTLLPVVFTDAVPMVADAVAATVGSIEDPEHLAVVVESLMAPAVGAGVDGPIRFARGDAVQREQGPSDLVDPPQAVGPWWLRGDRPRPAIRGEHAHCTTRFHQFGERRLRHNTNMTCDPQVARNDTQGIEAIPE
jgi:hypothetical protein